MSQRFGKRRKRYSDHPSYRYKLTGLIHVPGNSSDKCKVLVEFGYKYSKKSGRLRTAGNSPQKLRHLKEKMKNAIITNAVCEIILQDNNKLSSEEKAYEKIDS